MIGQLDIFDHSPAKQAEAWRAAAEASRQQFPDDDRRYRYYADRAEQIARAIPNKRQEANQ